MATDITRRGHKADQPCGYFEPSRKCYITQIQGKIYLNHKIVYALSHNISYTDIKFRFIHLDGDSSNNKLSNIGLLKESNF